MSPIGMAMFACELCDEEYEDHRLAMPPHVCEDCDAGDPEESQDLEDRLERVLSKGGDQ